MLNALEGLFARIGEWLNTVVPGRESPEEKARLFHYTIFLTMGLPTMLVYGILNFMRGDGLLCLLMLLLCVALLVGFLLLSRVSNDQILYRLNCALFGLLLIYLMLTGGENGSKALWMYTFPLVVFLLFGKDEGLLWSAIMLAITLLTFWGPLQDFCAFSYSALYKSRFVTTYLVISIITYRFEYSRFYYRLDLEEKNRLLEEDKKHMRHEIKKRRILEEELRRLAATDPLTGAANRRNFMESANKEFNRFRRYQHDLTIGMMDIDHFKSINDTYGHPVGDEVLKVLVRKCRAFLRESDLLGRLGGEEFALLLIETRAAEAQMVVDRLRQRISEIRLPVEKGDLEFTVSIGITNAAITDEALAPIMKRADEALYQAKAAGRNKVVQR